MQQRKRLDLGVHLPDPDPGISISLISLSLLIKKTYLVHLSEFHVTPTII